MANTSDTMTHIPNVSKDRRHRTETKRHKTKVLGEDVLQNRSRSRKLYFDKPQLHRRVASHILISLNSVPRPTKVLPRRTSSLPRQPCLHSRMYHSLCGRVFLGSGLCSVRHTPCENVSIPASPDAESPRKMIWPPASTFAFLQKAELRAY